MMCVFFIMISLGILGVLLGGVLWGINNEYKDFNNGVCPKCGKQLKFFDNDSHGGRGYCCDNCQYFTWVSYNWIDRNHINKI